MKYLKKFESNKKPKFKNGDHIMAIYDSTGYNQELQNYMENNVGIINDIITTYTNPYYKIIYYNSTIELDKWDGSYFIDEEYLRLATPEEIKNQKIKDAANKYNL